MAVTPISTAIPLRPADNIATKKNDDATAATLNYSSFLKLFIEQLKNQDPTEPMDTTAQMAQLATFSQVEQTIKTNTNLAQTNLGIVNLVAESRMAQAASWIGKTVTSEDGKTTGIVKEIKVGDTGLTATLANGKTLELTQGVKVSQ